MSRRIGDIVRGVPRVTSKDAMKAFGSTKKLPLKIFMFIVIFALSVAILYGLGYGFWLLLNMIFPEEELTNVIHQLGIFLFKI